MYLFALQQMHTGEFRDRVRGWLTAGVGYGVVALYI